MKCLVLFSFQSQVLEKGGFGCVVCLLSFWNCGKTILSFSEEYTAQCSSFMKHVQLETFKLKTSQGQIVVPTARWVKSTQMGRSVIATRKVVWAEKSRALSQPVCWGARPEAPWTLVFSPGGCWGLAEGASGPKSRLFHTWEAPAPREDDARVSDGPRCSNRDAGNKCC